MENTGTWTLEKIAYAVKNNIEAGLKTTANYNFSIPQLENEIIALRNKFVQEASLSNMIDKNDLYQTFNCITLDCENLSLCCNTFDKVTHFKLPKYSEIDYIGTFDYQTPFKIYRNKGRKYDKYKDKRLVLRPYVEIRQDNGENHGFVFNNIGNLKKISVRLILENPLDINNFYPEDKCEECRYNVEKDKFPVPGWMITSIIKHFSDNWSSYAYRFQGGQKSNTQTSIG